MNIGMIVASISRRGGGISEAARHLSRRLSQLPSVAVKIYGVEDTASEVDLPLWDGLDVELFANVGASTFHYAPAIYQALNRGNPDILHTHAVWLFPSIACRRYCLNTDKPYVVSPHGSLDSWALENSKARKRLASWAYENRNLRSAACLHALSHAEAESMRAYGLRNPIAVLPNGVAIPSGDGDASPPPWVESVDTVQKVLLYLGRLHPKKGLMCALESWKGFHATAEGRSWRFVIAGWSQEGHEQHLLEQTRRLALEDVAFIGAQYGDSKASALRHASAFILPSKSEGLPVAVLEAWAHALPVLMTPECNIPEGYSTGSAIRIGPTPPAITRGLLQLASMSDSERKAMGQNGRDLVSRAYNWNSVAIGMADVYRWILGGGPLPTCVSLP